MIRFKIRVKFLQNGFLEIFGSVNLFQAVILGSELTSTKVISEPYSSISPEMVIVEKLDFIF